MNQAMPSIFGCILSVYSIYPITHHRWFCNQFSILSCVPKPIVTKQNPNQCTLWCCLPIFLLSSAFPFPLGGALQNSLWQFWWSWYVAIPFEFVFFSQLTADFHMVQWYFVFFCKLLHWWCNLYMWYTEASCSISFPLFEIFLSRSAVMVHVSQEYQK